MGGVAPARELSVGELGQGLDGEERLPHLMGEGRRQEPKLSEAGGAQLINGIVVQAHSGER